MRFLIQLAVYVCFGAFSLWLNSPEIQINFLLGWIAWGIASGVHFEIIKKRKPYFKFIQYPFETNFTNNLGEIVSVYSGNLDENGNPANLILIDVLCPQPAKSDIIRVVNTANSDDVA